MLHWSYITADNQSFEERAPLNSHLGFGVYETIRLRFKSNVWHTIQLNSHIHRILKSAVQLNLFAIDNDKILELIKLKVSTIKSTKDQILRLVLYKSAFGISIDSWSPRFNCEKGIKIKSYFAEREFPQHKHCSALISYQYANEAVKNGYEEALLVDRDNIVREGAWSNFFWIDNTGIIWTPEDKILPGVTRGIVTSNQSNQIKSMNRTFQDVKYNINAAFITHSTHGIVPVSMLDEMELEISPIVKELSKWYESILTAI